MTVTKSSIWKAALIAPLGVPLSITFAVAWEALSNFGVYGLRDLPVAMLFVFLFGLPISYGAMLLFGLPYLLWLRSRGWLTWAFVCIGAAVLGSAIWVGYWQLSLRPPSLARTIPVGAMIGLVVGIIFSLTAKLPK
ncbi:hypothetical protein LJB71_00325 [Thermomonas sp. S9]|uniref:hypothetical protein n=1 Tax=Thermomonas sp. S9 TaxID=2885203 RepID=UPI00216ADB1B|nr:hypothetical protein [Thermomonas sp. S9]MCR6494845.1 hypothetical protein [Thermomonas sp. S9]